MQDVLDSDESDLDHTPPTTDTQTMETVDCTSTTCKSNGKKSNKADPAKIKRTSEIFNEEDRKLGQFLYENHGKAECVSGRDEHR